MNDYKYILAQANEEGDEWIRRGAGGSEESQAYVAAQYGDPPKISELFGSLDNLTPILAPLGIFLAVLMVVIGGYMWMTSSGSPDKVKQAQGTLTWAVIGLVLVMIAALLIKSVVDYIGGM